MQISWLKFSFGNLTVGGTYCGSCVCVLVTHPLLRYLLCIIVVPFCSCLHLGLC